MQLPVARLVFRPGYIIFLLIGSVVAQQAVSDTPLSPRLANYDIHVKLLPEENLLQGRQLLHWKNPSDRDVQELRFHLYLNGFRNNRSTFMIESGGVHRGNRVDQEQGWGFSEIKRIVVLPQSDSSGRHSDLSIRSESTLLEIPGVDITSEMEFMQPDIADHVYDKTYFRLPLPQAVPPGKTVSLFIEFTAMLPDPPAARTGTKEEYVFAGQWFPKIAKYTPKGWNSHQFHLNSEFFADYGVYNVWINVPEDRIVGATGLEVEQQKQADGTVTHYYHAADVHDFAWTASPDFEVFTGRVQDVELRALVQKDHRAQGARHIEAARVAVEYFQNWYGDYPFPNLTIVDPRRGADGSGGMEYPTLITAGTSYGMMENVRLLELVIIHEFGHNFWYHLLASNEFEEAWLDEGINTFTETEIMNDHYGPQGDLVDVFGIRFNDLDMQRIVYRLLPDVDTVVQPAWTYYGNLSYGINSYMRPGVLLHTLKNYVGADVMREMIRTYVERWRFKNPTTRDFIDVCNDVAGQDLNWFFDQALYSAKVLDYSVSYLRSSEYKPGSGFDFNRDVSSADSTLPSTSATVIDPLQQGQSDSLAAAKKLYFSKVKIRRLGDFEFPVEIEMIFSDGDTLQEQWDGHDLWKQYTYVKPARLLSAEVDPDRKITLDINYTNNSMAAKAQSLGVNKLATRFLFWMQFLLDQPEMLNWPSFMVTE